MEVPQIPALVAQEYEQEAMTAREDVTRELQRAWREAPPLIEKAQALQVRTAEDKQIAVEVLGKLKTLADELTPIRKRQAAPYLRMGKAVQAFYDAILDPMEEAIEELKTRYENRVLVERQEAERLAREQKDREDKARQEAERLAKAARDQAAADARTKAEEEARGAGMNPGDVQEYGDLAAQEAAAAAPAPARVIPRSVPAAPPKTLKAGTSSGTVKDLVAVTMQDFPAFAAWAVMSGRYELLDWKEAPVKALHKAGLREVPGVLFEVRPNLAISGPK